MKQFDLIDKKAKNLDLHCNKTYYANVKKLKRESFWINLSLNIKYSDSIYSQSSPCTLKEGLRNGVLIKSNGDFAMFEDLDIPSKLIILNILETNLNLQ